MKKYVLIILITFHLMGSSLYAENILWIPNPTLESLFRPPKT